MKNTKILIIGILFLGLFISTVSADPTVNHITTNPDIPKPESTVTIIANISGENISKVRLSLSECNHETGLCYENQNVEMALNSEGEYEGEFTLEDSLSRTDHLQYVFVVTDNGADYQLTDDSWRTDLDLENSVITPNVDNGEDNGSPGFELVIVLIAVFISLIFLKRKR